MLTNDKALQILHTWSRGTADGKVRVEGVGLCLWWVFSFSTFISLSSSRSLRCIKDKGPERQESEREDEWWWSLVVAYGRDGR